MNADLLLSYYDRIADAPDAVVQLRRLILDLAVRGKLVPQDPNDEPASELLRRIAAEAISTKVDAVSDRDWPIDLPKSWLWIPLGRLVAHSDAGWSPKTEDHPRSGNEWGVLKVSAVSWDKFREWENKQVLPGTEPKPQAQVKRGDFLISRANTAELIARAVIVEEEPIKLMMSDKIVRLRLSEYCDHRFVWIVNNYADFSRKYYVRHASGVSPSMKNVSRDVIMNLPFPLPPLAEQRRIVARVDELMALCDQLERARAQRETKRDRLAAASLAQLNRPDPDPQCFREQIAFALQNLAALTTRPDQVKALRQTILNLAVRGKLVAQDANDEPIRVALAAADCRRIEAAKKDRRADSGTQELLAGEARWPVPDHWLWRGLADLVLFVDYRGNTPPKTIDGVRLITAKNVRQGFISLTPEEFVSKQTYHTWMTRGFPASGDILFTTEAPMGNAAVVNLTEDFALAQRLICFQSYGAVDSDFLALQLLSEPFQTILDITATGLTAKGIKAAKLKRLPIALPPLAEQRRIVAKVGELMALCDRLAASLAAGDATRRLLLEAVLHAALEG